KDASARTLGDEPYQFYLKFPKIRVAVDGDRVRGVQRLLALGDRPQVILLDDAFQHRRVKAGLNILLTMYGDIFTDDFLLPTGNLRESRRSAKRADIIIVTKCPVHLTESEQRNISDRIKLQDHQQLYFSYIDCDEMVHSESGSLPLNLILNQQKFVLAGIAKPEHFFKTVYREGDTILKFADHHHFSEKEILVISEQMGDRIIVTTEKDYVRLKHRLPADKLYYLPIRSVFVGKSELFDKTILNYVGSGKTNSGLH